MARLSIVSCESIKSPVGGTVMAMGGSFSIKATYVQDEIFKAARVAAKSNGLYVKVTTGNQTDNCLDIICKISSLEVK